MKTFLQATTTDGKIELFNLENVLSITPRANGTTKILMGAGLYWIVYTNSIEIVDCINELLRAIKGDF